MIKCIESNLQMEGSVSVLLSEYTVITEALMKEAGPCYGISTYDELMNLVKQAIDFSDEKQKERESEALTEPTTDKNEEELETLIDEAQSMVDTMTGQTKTMAQMILDVLKIKK